MQGLEPQPSKPSWSLLQDACHHLSHLPKQKGCPICSEPSHLESLWAKVLMGRPLSHWNNLWTHARGGGLYSMWIYPLWAFGLYAREHCFVHGRKHLKACPRINRDLQRQLMEELAHIFFLTAASQDELLRLGKNPRWESAQKPSCRGTHFLWGKGARAVFCCGDLEHSALSSQLGRGESSQSPSEYPQWDRHHFWVSW